MTQSNNSSQRSMHDTLNMMYGTYADVLFVLLPFFVLGLQRVWSDRTLEIVMAPDMSIAAAILGGLAMGKFVLGLITNRDLGRFKERIVFFIAVTLVLVLAPAILLMLLISGPAETPELVAFIQPILLIIAISLYTTAISISNLLTRPDPMLVGEPEGPAEVHQGEERELDLPRRDDGEPGARSD